MRWRRGLALHLEASTVIFDVTPMVLKHSKMFLGIGRLIRNSLENIHALPRI